MKNLVLAAALVAAALFGGVAVPTATLAEEAAEVNASGYTDCRGIVVFVLTLQGSGKCNGIFWLDDTFEASTTTTRDLVAESRLRLYGRSQITDFANIKVRDNWPEGLNEQILYHAIRDHVKGSGWIHMNKHPEKPSTICGKEGGWVPFLITYPIKIKKQDVWVVIPSLQIRAPFAKICDSKWQGGQNVIE